MNIQLVLILTLIATFSQAQSVKDLDFLIGKWETSEVVFAGTDREYVETGERECSYFLDGNYIKCETKGIRKGRNRSYAFLISYDPKKEHFRFLSISSDYPFAGHQRLGD